MDNTNHNRSDELLETNDSFSKTTENFENGQINDVQPTDPVDEIQATDPVDENKPIDPSLDSDGFPINRPNFFKCYYNFWRHSFNFEARTRRREYWLSYLWFYIIQIIYMVYATYFENYSNKFLEREPEQIAEEVTQSNFNSLFLIFQVFTIIFLAHYLPYAAIITRRYNDVTQDSHKRVSEVIFSALTVFYILYIGIYIYSGLQDESTTIQGIQVIQHLFEMFSKIIGFFILIIGLKASVKGQQTEDPTQPLKFV